jgi:hypothetical protein
VSRRTPITYTVDPDTGCWLWPHHTSNGYGRIKRNGKSLLVHRVIYARKHGSIPQGMDLDHVCRNRRCVNPDHLEPVPRAVNCQRGANAKLTPSDVAEIRALRGSETQEAIAERFGVTVFNIRAIHGNLTWKNLPAVIPPGYRRPLTEEQKREIRSLKGSMTQSEIASIYGVCQAHISRIQRS